MQAPSISAESEDLKKRFWPWLARAPLTRIAVFAVLLVGLLYSKKHLLIAFVIMRSPEQASAAQLTVTVVLNLVVIFFTYWLLVHWLEQRKVDELAARKLLPDTARGLLLGGGLMLLVTGVLWLVGAYRIVGFQADAPWFRGVLLLGLMTGVVEEIISRGVLFRVVEDGMGSWIALAVSSLLFGVAHAMNTNATLWSFIAIAILGVLLGLLYMVTRSLYVCIGMHAAWNIVQGPVLGIPVSGNDPHGLLVAILSGPTWLSGGAFGAETSVVSVLLLTAVNCALAVLAVRRRLTKPPFWRRRARAVQIEAPAASPDLRTID